MKSEVTMAGELSELNGQSSAHRKLQLDWALQNHIRLEPGLPLAHSEWKTQLATEFSFALREEDALVRARAEVRGQAATAPHDPEGFIRWFEDLKTTGPGQNDPLFAWLAEEATSDQMTWFLKQEVAGEAGFEDLVALAQVKVPVVQAKLELARNYWDEMGRGNERGMHGPMLGRLAREIGLHGATGNESIPPAEVVTESLALSNLMTSLAYHRRYAYQAIGALGVIELTAPGRAAKVYEGLKRLDISANGRQYYLLHSTLDVKHSESWNREVLMPLVTHDAQLMQPIAEGALLRLKAGQRCFERYRRDLEVPAQDRQSKAPVSKQAETADAVA